MRFYATTWDQLHLELERAFIALANPQSPPRVFAAATVDLPPAADHKYCIAFDITLGTLVTSNGTAWV